MEQTEIQRMLEKKRSELLSRNDQLEADIRRKKDPLSGDSEEQAVQKENDEVLDALSVETREEIMQIENALKRIKAGTFHICSNCGQEIDKERRKFLMDTTLCIACATNS